MKDVIFISPAETNSNTKVNIKIYKIKKKLKNERCNSTYVSPIGISS